VFDCLSRTFITEPKLAIPLTAISGVNVTDWEDTVVPKLNGSLINFRTDEMSRSLAFISKNENFALGSEWELRLFDRSGNIIWEKSAPSVVWAVNASQDG
jgi:hypothetical protein